MSETLSLPKQRNTSVNALRGLIAVDILLYHMGVQDITSQIGQMGVCFFLITSGCFLTLGSGHRGGWRNFARRAARIYPLHWLGLAAMAILDIFLVHKLKHSATTFTLNALLLQAYVPDFDVGYSYNRVSWFLCSLIACYAVAPWLIGRFRRLRLRHIAAALLLLTVAIGVLNWCVDELWRIYIELFPLARVLDFAWGVFLGETIRRIDFAPLRSRLTTARSTLLELAVFVFAAVAVAVNYRHMELVERTGYVVWWLLPAWLVAWCLMLTHRREGWVGKLLSFRLFQWLGDSCYEIYLLEAVIALSLSYCVAPVFGHFGIMWPSSLAFNVPLIIVIAALLHRAFTIPVNRAVAKLFNRSTHNDA